MEFEEALQKADDFLRGFPDLGNPKYIPIINSLRANNERSLEIDFADILEHDYDLAFAIIDEGESIINAIEAAFENIWNIDPEMNRTTLHIRIFNIESEQVEISNIRVEHFNKIIQFYGLVKRISDPKPETVEAIFECQRCGQLQSIIQESENEFLKKPYICTNPACGRKGPFKEIKQESTIVNFQVIKIQESPEHLRGGQMPRIINCVIRDDWMDRVQAGNRVVVTGIMKGVHERVSGKEKKTWRFHIEIIHIRAMEQDTEIIELTPEEIEEIRELSQTPFIHQKVARSICPTICGNDDVKLAIALHLFKGETKETADGTRLRGDSHILLVGDPGTGKSQILRYVANIAPRGVFTSGKGASGVGLTAGMVRDETTGGWAVEAGAMVLADGGHCIIDEFDKIKPDERAAINNAMEQQTVTITKIETQLTMNARTSLLCACNPKYGRWDQYKPIADQINLDPTLLSRFDLCFIIVDKPDKERDGRISDHIIKLHRNISSVSPEIAPDTLQKYIYYANQACTPRLQPLAGEKLRTFYRKTREGGTGESPIPITPRQLEALIRLCESLAKMRLSNEVSVYDTEVVIGLYRRCMSVVATDLETGKLDIDTLMTGTRKSQRDKIILLTDLIVELDKKNDGNGAPEDEIYAEGEARGLSEGFIRVNIGKFKNDGAIFEPRNGLFKVIRERI